MALRLSPARLLWSTVARSATDRFPSVLRFHQYLSITSCPSVLGQKDRVLSALVQTEPDLLSPAGYLRVKVNGIDAQPRRVLLR